MLFESPYSDMELIRKALIQRAARKLSRWFSHRRSSDYTRQRDRDALDRAFKEAEAEIDGAPDYVEHLNGNELTRLLDETAKHTDRQLQ
jgi:hypothetical protein